ncbi:MAG: UDP-3-O-(3-hydroxymyristoyl)glucosamine N-acyltransferase [Deltaproteobacteria bacterium]|nr:UDP-3-O-(3-hydroxymyristoyl)glucosamine N-acyltransferase [Deltaproteobacteria bacterium]
MEKTVAELAELAGATVVGDGSVSITGLAAVSDAQKGDITFFSNLKYRSRLLETRASAVISAETVEGLHIPFLITPNPYAAYAVIARLFFMKPHQPRGISNDAHIAPSARIGADSSIYPFVYVGEQVTIGDRVTLHPGVHIGDGTVVGDDVIMHPNVTVHHGSVIGSRVILYPGVVIGGDGFGYAREKNGYTKIPQVGIVQIDDDVEIGANSTVDRAALGKTWIKRGAKIDNLVMIAHNVIVGEHTVIVSQSGVAGSSEIGDNVVLAAQSGVSGHIKIGDKVTVAARGGISKDIPPNSIVSGSPSMPHRNWLKSKVICGRLPELHADVKTLKERVAALEDQLCKKERS